MDVNESLLPKLKIYEPLIPREVMVSLGLNRLEKEEEIQRYHFMRLVSCAKQVHLIFEENQVKEKSRFIEELLWKKQKQLNALDVIQIPKAVFGINVISHKTTIAKTPDIINFISLMGYSASRINTYLNCPLEFYYKYIVGLSETEDLLDEPQAPDLGTFIHELLNEGFQRFLNARPLIDRAFRKQLMNLFEERFSQTIARRMKSDSLLLKGIIENRLRHFLDAEAERGVERIVCLEKEFEGEIQLNGSRVHFTSKIDRVDQLSDNHFVIIDYKTGGVDLVPKRLESLEQMEYSRRAIKETIKSFQLPLYYYFVHKQQSSSDLNAELYSIRTLERKPFIAEEDYPRRERVLEICLKALECIFRELLNPDVGFEPDKNERRCQFCSFASLCK